MISKINTAVPNIETKGNNIDVVATSPIIFRGDMNSVPSKTETGVDDAVDGVDGSDEDDDDDELELILCIIEFTSEDDCGGVNRACVSGIFVDSTVFNNNEPELLFPVADKTVSPSSIPLPPNPSGTPG